tara:strand:+ start:485 stop:613 length:129 start_codon:yes stop_codon:yes gene_type:complete
MDQQACARGCWWLFWSSSGEYRDQGLALFISHSQKAGDSTLK